MKLRNSIHIIGEGLTEKYYFQHLKKINNYRYAVKPRFSNNNTISQFDKKTKELLSGGVKVVCVFDADVSQRNQTEKKLLLQFIKEYKDSEDVIICDSFPSIEFWFLLHFIETNKHFNNYRELRNELRKHLPDYDKKEKYLQQEKWVKCLVEKQRNAIKNAKQIKKGASFSNIYKAFDLFVK
jgi:RloB-like protein